MKRPYISARLLRTPNPPGGWQADKSCKQSVDRVPYSPKEHWRSNSFNCTERIPPSPSLHRSPQCNAVVQPCNLLWGVAGIDHRPESLDV
jgi:hypothetical protein